MKNKKVWIMWGNSESGDEYKKVIVDHQPTPADERMYVEKYTPEALDIGGEGAGGSYVYVDWEKAELF